MILTTCSQIAVTAAYQDLACCAASTAVTSASFSRIASCMVKNLASGATSSGMHLAMRDDGSRGSFNRHRISYMYFRCFRFCCGQWKSSCGPRRTSRGAGGVLEETEVDGAVLVGAVRPEVVRNLRTVLVRDLVSCAAEVRLEVRCGRCSCCRRCRCC